ncbi:MAG: sodium:calcium antiporter, partial [Myxococcales bacterium]|nr:sodium:calcium antiporter [Myxococcales bacterium]
SRMAISLGIILLSTVAIWWFSDRLEAVAHTIGHHLRMPESVKGAVLYAIPSSFPELATATISVVVLDPPVFEVGVGTIAGSAVFNLLIIPSLAVIVASRHLRKQGQKMDAINISPQIFLRDGVFYLGVVGLFIGVAIYGQFTKIIALAFLAIYAGYVFMLYRMTMKHREATEPHGEDDEEQMSLGMAMFWLVFSMAALGVACYFLVEATVEVAGHLGMNPYVVAVVLTAAATSIPDTLISVAAAKKSGEEAESAVVNAFSSNIFDVLVCLAVPALLYPTAVDLNAGKSIVSLVLLAVTTAATLLMIKVGNRVTRPKAYVMLGMYAVFVGAAFFNDEILDAAGIHP